MAVFVQCGEQVIDAVFKELQGKEIVVTNNQLRSFFDRDFLLAEEHLRKLSSILQDQTILITGGTGFFGKWLTLLLTEMSDRLRLNLRLIIFSRQAEDVRRQFPWIYDHPCVQICPGDVLKMQDVAIDACDYVIHAATEASEKLNRERPRLMLEVAALGTSQVLEFAERVGARRVLLASSGAIYGPQPPHITHLKESDFQVLDPGNIANAYAIGKLAAEYLCNAQPAGKPETVIARCFAFVGPFLPRQTHFAVGNFIQDALENREIIIKGDGRPRRSYMYGADLVIWLTTLLLKGASHTAYNVGGDCSLSIQELAVTVREVCSLNQEIQILTPVDPAARVPQYVPDVSKARQELGLELWTDVREAIQRTYDFARVAKQ